MIAWIWDMAAIHTDAIAFFCSNIDKEDKLLMIVANQSWNDSNS